MHPAPNHTVVSAFFALQLAGCAIFAFMFISALVSPKTIKRHPIWYNFALSFIIFSLSYSILAFAPGLRNNPHELAGSGICVAQAALIYAAPFLAPSASAALIALLLLNILSTLSGQTRKASPISLTIALACPWMLWSAVLLGTTAFIVRDVSVAELSPNGTFCIVTRSVLPRVSAAVAAIFALAILAFELGIAYLLYKHRAVDHVFRESIAMAIRTSILTIIAVAAVVTGLLSAGMAHKPVLDIMIAMVPFVTSITFATQRDLWARYMFWKEPQPASSVVDDEHGGRSSLEAPGFSLATSTDSLPPASEKPSWGYSAAIGRRFSGYKA